MASQSLFTRLIPELDEARLPVRQNQRVARERRCARRYRDAYRNNAQSRVLEEALIQGGLPYRIYAKVILERQEIRDALSYLRLMSNRSNDGI